MEKNIGIGLKIKQQREKRGLTLNDLSGLTGISIPRLSKIENGEVKNPKKELVEKISKALLISFNEVMGAGKQPLKIGVGATLMSAPILYGIAERNYSSNLELCYYENGEDLENFTSITKKEQLPTALNEPLTAPKLINFLLAKKFSAIFVPSETYEFVKDDVLRVASVMNTAKGALSLLVCSKQPVKEVKSNFASKIYSPAAFLYLKDTIADKVVRNIFLIEDYKDFSFNSVEMEDLSTFISKLSSQIRKHCGENRIAFYAGWEPHISLLEKSLTEYSSNAKLFTQVIDISEFTKLEEPFQHISFDCVIRADTQEFLKANEDFKNFFKLLRSSIYKLNEIKAYKGIHPSLKKISELLVMDNYAATHQALHKMNFELQFYPEWIL